uniref:Uncharacterized protein n=1 Tax=Klebsiella pneumoniae TaxID=573 RepID=A0A3G4RJB1_KLEPN|nr:hypothetical protein [Klebsiella pneumoniae]
MRGIDRHAETKKGGVENPRLCSSSFSPYGRPVSCLITTIMRKLTCSICNISRIDPSVITLSFSLSGERYTPLMPLCFPSRRVSITSRYMQHPMSGGRPDGSTRFRPGESCRLHPMALHKRNSRCHYKVNDGLMLY